MLWTYLPLKLRVIHQRKCRKFKSYANLRVTITNKGLEMHMEKLAVVIKFESYFCEEVFIQ